MSYPSTATIKKLSILSRNQCAFPNCPTPLVDENGIILGEMCHIKAKNAGGKRYDIAQTNQERDAFENLVMMCPVHHTVIDADEISYTVERLREIKANQENQSLELPEQSNLQKLLEENLRLISEQKPSSSNPSEIIKEANTSLMKAQKLAAMKTHNMRRQNWFYSDNGLKDVVSSINEIYSLIETQISSNAETFETLGIGLNKKEKFLRCIFSDKFGSQLEVIGFQENSYDNKPANISLKIWLFSKRLTHQNGLFYTDAILRLHFNPDLSPDGQLIWKEQENSSLNLSAEGICEKMFDLLINEINKKSPLDETVPGGRYLVNEQFVDAWGNPIEDDYGNDANDFMNDDW